MPSLNRAASGPRLFRQRQRHRHSGGQTDERSSRRSSRRMEARAGSTAAPASVSRSVANWRACSVAKFGVESRGRAGQHVHAVPAAELQRRAVRELQRRRRTLAGAGATMATTRSGTTGDAAASSRSPMIAAIFCRAKKSILIIEDDRDFAQWLLDLARAQGFKAVVTPRGKVGLELVREFAPAAITLDLSLPDIDGWQSPRSVEIRSGTRHIPVFVISAPEEPRECAQARRAPIPDQADRRSRRSTKSSRRCVR